MTSRWTAVLLLFFCLFASHARAQATGGEDNPDSKVLYEFGVHIGDLLPNQIPGVTEILGLGGVRGGFRIAPLTYCEGGFLMGNGSGVEWKNAHLDVRMDIPVENLIGFAGLGVDTVYYKGADQGSHVVFGGHAGGGIMALMTGNLWFRGDMKFSFNPGTALYVGAGFVFRFGG
jgi:hypothetical protein